MSMTAPDLSQIQQLLARAAKLAHPQREKTLFSIAGRGYYENPTSDVLAFFLRPDAEHDFGTLFLASLFECMGMSAQAIPELKGATVEREIKTQQGNRIDLQIVGSDWCLIVENKIWHLQNNPFDDYERHAKSLQKQQYFAILSPNGETPSAQTWKGVSYEGYCRVVKHHLAKALFDTEHSKWHLFAREFIVHLEAELYSPAMNNEQAAFVEQNAEGIEFIKTLESDYRQFLQDRLKEILNEKFPGWNFETKDDKWAIRCYSLRWGKSHLAFWRQGKDFMVSVYLVGVTDRQKATAEIRFQGMTHKSEPPSSMLWYAQPGSATREAGLSELCRLAAIVNELFQAP